MLVEWNGIWNRIGIHGDGILIRICLENFISYARKTFLLHYNDK